MLRGELLRPQKLTGDIVKPVTSAGSSSRIRTTHNVTAPLGHAVAQIITIIVVARVFGFFCKKIGQPSVIGEIAAGIFLGPSFVGHYFPEFSAFVFPATSLSNLQFFEPNRPHPVHVCGGHGGGFEGTAHQRGGGGGHTNRWSSAMPRHHHSFCLGHGIGVFHLFGICAG